jgi:flagellar hook-associated protein 2
MSGGFSASGLITGIDSASIIKQLLQIERQPEIRIKKQIAAFEKQRDAIRDLRTQLTTLRDKAQDFQFGDIFDKFTTNSTNTGVLTVSAGGSNPASGSFLVDVLQVASATVATSSASLGAAIDPAVSLDSSGLSQTITAGDFSINGVTIAVDPSTDSLNTVISAINASGAGVTASYDAVTDKVTIANSTPADTSFINFGATGDTSDFLDVIGVTNATQTTGGSGETQATSVANLGAVNPNNILNVSNFAGGAGTAGSFQINGISITIDPTVDTLENVLTRINASDAGVTASYDSTNDTIRVVADNLGSPTISFTSGTSNFLDVTNLTSAVQTAGNDAQFTIDGGPVQTRNTNTVSDAISDITLNLSSVGTSTISVETDRGRLQRVGEEAA